jgi:hypothetical protein
MIAALRAARARKPAKLIAATGVAAPEALRLIGDEADEVVCLETPAILYASGISSATSRKCRMTMWWRRFGRPADHARQPDRVPDIPCWSSPKASRPVGHVDSRARRERWAHGRSTA